MTDLINNIVNEGYIPDDWRKSILCLCTGGKVQFIQGYFVAGAADEGT